MNPRDVVRDELGLSRGVSRRRVLQAVGGTVAIGAASSGASAQQGGPAEFDQVETGSSDAASWDFQELTGDVVGRSSPIDNLDVGYYVGETPPSTGEYLVFDDPAGSNNANLTAVKRYSGGGWVTCENARYYQDGSVTHEFDDADIKTWQGGEWVPIPDAGTAIPDSVVSRDQDNNSNVRDLTLGLQIESDDEWPEIGAELSANTTDATRAYIYRTSDGQLMDDVDITGLTGGDTFTLAPDLQPDTTYNFVIDAEGSDYTNGQDDSATFPYESSDGRLRIVDGAAGPDSSSSAAQNIVTVGNVGFD